MPIFPRLLTAAAAAVACTAAVAWAEASVTVQAPWARATARSATTGAIYFTLVNDAGAPDRLVSAASPAARTVELHTHIDEGGVLRMRPVAGVDVPAGERVAFQPGGLHVMLIGLNGALKEGRSVPVSLTFERAGTIAVEARILPAGARAPR